jgi:hypothetical protein
MSGHTFATAALRISYPPVPIVPLAPKVPSDLVSALMALTAQGGEIFFEGPSSAIL